MGYSLDEAVIADLCGHLEQIEAVLPSDVVASRVIGPS